MPKSPVVWTLVTVDDKGDPRVEEFDMFSALEIRMGGIQSNDPQYKLLENGRPVEWDWSNPKLNINGVETEKKPRRKRRSSAEVAAEKSAKEAAKKPPLIVRDAPHTLVKP